jgi:Recombination endonuclease VII
MFGEAIVLKKCSRCELEKPETIEYFPRNQFGKRGFRSHCKVCTNKTNRETRERRKHLWHRSRRNGWLRRLYGIRNEDYERMLKQQGGRCAICRSTSPKRARQVYFSVDHCHQTGRVRGLLCVNCNTLVGLLERSGAPSTLSFEAVAYIKGARFLPGGPSDDLAAWESIQQSDKHAQYAAMDLRVLEAQQAVLEQKT